MSAFVRRRRGGAFGSRCRSATRSSLDPDGRRRPRTTGRTAFGVFKGLLRARPIIVEWERDARHSAGLSFGDSSLRYRALHFFKVTPSRNLI
ncbi:hypothetical protein EVAR_38610_1 [Eumeta japonica]|uniref:Uncharacterized protein n=1 Tax=Eumeta variegata TaxID=151549 RepID=A0A4C1WQ60_EUMVA|nr:hypothetical protein EVAR_38610_1 [Eumeta japonica]